MRPKLTDAHKFFREGSYRWPPWVSDAERETELLRVVDELETLTKRQFPRTNTLEYALLKAHLIVEYALTEYVRMCAQVRLERTEVRFTFAQKLDLAYLLGFGVNSATLIPSIELLNRVRNQAAHRFEVDRALVDELIHINHEEYTSAVIVNDRQRISFLRRFCQGVASFTGGYLIGSYAAAI